MTFEEDRVEPQQSQVKPNQIDIPDKPIDEGRRGGEDERDDRHAPPRGPFRPMPDPEEQTIVEEAPRG